jgi:hypothetical protein
MKSTGQRATTHASKGRWHSVCRSTTRAAAFGTFAATAWAASAAAEPPYPPEESAECHPYGTQSDQCDFYPDPPADGDTPTDPTNTSSNECTWSQNYGTDIIKLTGDRVDFGDSSFVGGAPLGVGSVQWSVPDCRYYTARLQGTLHLDGASGKFARMHVSYWWDDELLATHHSITLHARNNRRVEQQVDMAPLIGHNVDEVHVCTEISNDGENFDAVTCKTRLL